jgi:hypothetical protein
MTDADMAEWQDQKNRAHHPSSIRGEQEPRSQHITGVIQCGETAQALTYLTDRDLKCTDLSQRDMNAEGMLAPGALANALRCNQ